MLCPLPVTNEDDGVSAPNPVAQVILRWHLQRGLTPIPKSSSKAHVVENFGVFDFALTPGEMAALEELNRQPSFEGSVTAPNA